MSKMHIARQFRLLMGIMVATWFTSETRERSREKTIGGLKKEGYDGVQDSSKAQGDQKTWGLGHTSSHVEL